MLSENVDHQNHTSKFVIFLCDLYIHLYVEGYIQISRLLEGREDTR